MTHICISDLTIISSDNGWSAQGHYLNQCWNIFNWTLRNKLQWNFMRNSNIFIRENGFECVVYKIASILPRPQCVNLIRLIWYNVQILRYFWCIFWHIAIYPMKYEPCFVLFILSYLYFSSCWIQAICLPIYFKATSLTLRQSLPKDKRSFRCIENVRNHSKTQSVHNSWDIFYWWHKEGIASLLTHWGLVYMCYRSESSLDQVMAWCLFGTKPLPDPMRTYCELDH